jgi:hypothetical protein
MIVFVATAADWRFGNRRSYPDHVLNLKLSSPTAAPHDLPCQTPGVGRPAAFRIPHPEPPRSDRSIVAAPN